MTSSNSLLFLLLGLFGLPGAQEPSLVTVPQQQKCVLEGTASDANTGELLRKVTVRLGPTFGGDIRSVNTGYVAMTDAAGHFHFENVLPGDYVLQGERTGYWNSILGARKPGSTGMILHLKAADKLADLHLKLWPRCIVSGKVADENGEPVSAQIYAVSQMWFRGRRRYFPDFSGETDAAGDYRISDLEPGRYFFYAAPQSEGFVEEQGQPEKRLVPVFYPDSQTLDNATAFELHPGQDLTGINFRLRAAPAFHIRGKVDASALKSREGLEVNANRRGQIAYLSELSSEVKSDGSFNIPGVPAGSYELQVCGQGEHLCIGNLALDVLTADVSGVVIRMPNPIEVKGTVRTLDGESGHFAGSYLALNSTGAPLNEGYHTAVEPEGTFKFQDMSPGEYVLTVSLPGASDYVKSILYGQQEVLGLPIDFSGDGADSEVQVIVSKGAGQVEGTVQIGDEQESQSRAVASGGFQVALVSERQPLDGDGVLLARTDQNQHFSFKKVPPGKYYAFAVADIERGIWENRDFVAQIQSSGKEIEVAENAKMQIQLPMLSAGEVERAMSSIGQ